jgi:hypothetical protein
MVDTKEAPKAKPTTSPFPPPFKLVQTDKGVWTYQRAAFGDNVSTEVVLNAFPGWVKTRDQAVTALGTLYPGSEIEGGGISKDAKAAEVKAAVAAHKA